MKYFVDIAEMGKMWESENESIFALWIGEIKKIRKNLDLNGSNMWGKGGSKGIRYIFYISNEVQVGSIFQKKSISRKNLME